MRLIDADALSAKMYHEAFETDTDFQRWDGGCWIRYKMFENALKDAPTIKPEQHTGKWEELGENKDGTHNIRCNQCVEVFKSRGHANSYYTKRKYRFCPNCGVKMNLVKTITDGETTYIQDNDRQGWTGYEGRKR